MTRDAQMRTWVAALIRSFGEPRRPVNIEPLEALHTQKRYTDMVGMIAKQLGLGLHVRVGFVKSGGLEVPAWIDTSGLWGLYGSEAFKHSTVTMYLQRKFLATAPFIPVVMGMAHELSHVVLDSLEHPLRREEKVVDLAAMHLGYRGIWQNVHADVAPSGGDHHAFSHFAGTMIRSYGYLSTEEILYAKTLMQT